jgi:ankyrin repeat protein
VLSQLAEYKTRNSLELVVDLYMEFLFRHERLFATSSKLLNYLTRVGNELELAAFLKAGFSPNARDFEGLTLLHYAALNNSLAAAKLLKKKGASYRQTYSTSCCWCWTVKGDYPEDLTYDVDLRPFFKKMAADQE